MKKLLGFNTYLVICILNAVKDILDFADSIASLLSVILVFISIINLINVHYRKRIPTFIRGLDILLLVISICGFSDIIQGRSVFIHGGYLASYNFLLTHWLSILPIYSFYYYAWRGDIGFKQLRISFILFFIVCLLSFANNMLNVQALLHKDDIVNNSAYSFLPLIPLLYLTKIKNLHKIMLLFILVSIVLAGMKRGAILIAAILFIIYFFSFIKDVSRKQRKAIVFVGILLLIIAAYSVYQFYLSNQFFQSRVEDTLEGKTSGRDKIYSAYWDYFMTNTDSMEFMFGHGGFATVELFGQYAHNDWIEIAINNGVIGLIAFVLFWLLACVEWLAQKDKIRKKAFFGILTILFLETLFSMSISAITSSAALSIGYCIGNINNRVILNNQH